MKRLLSIATIKVLFVVTAFAQAGATKGGKQFQLAPIEGPKSLLSLYLSQHELKQGVNDTVRFRLMSLGTEDLVVSNIELSSGLTLMNKPIGPIHPGNYVELAVAIAPSDQKGLSERKAVIISNSGRREEVVFKVTTK